MRHIGWKTTWGRLDARIMTPVNVARTGVVLCMVVLCVSCVGPGPHKGGVRRDRYKIRLRNRTLTPKRGIEPALLTKLKITERPRVHAIVQFRRDLSLEEHEFLHDSGVILQGYLGSHTHGLHASEDGYRHRPLA